MGPKEKNSKILRKQGDKKKKVCVYVQTASCGNYLSNKNVKRWEIYLNLYLSTILTFQYVMG